VNSSVAIRVRNEIAKSRKRKKIACGFIFMRGRSQGFEASPDGAAAPFLQFNYIFSIKCCINVE
jgi:hypothetical protein